MNQKEQIQKLKERYNKIVLRGFSDSDKTLEELDAIDLRILTIQENEFVKNKYERLKEGQNSSEQLYTDSEIREIIEETVLDIRKTELPEYNPLENFTTASILSVVNPQLLERLQSRDSRTSKTSEKSETSKTSKTPSLDSLNSLEHSNIPGVKDSIKASKEAEDRNASNIQKHEAKDQERIKLDIDPRDPEYNPLKIKVEDTSSIAEIHKNNEEIYARLLEMGEVQMANHVHGMMSRVEVGPKYKYVSEIQENTEELKSIKDSNSGIHKELAELRWLLRTRQDTEIESVEDTLAEQYIIEEVQKESVQEEVTPSFLEALLGMLFGRNLIRLLLGAAGSLLRIAKGILAPALGWLWKAIAGNASKLFNTLMKGPIDLFNGLRDRVSNFLDNTWK